MPVLDGGRFSCTKLPAGHLIVVPGLRGMPIFGGINIGTGCFGEAIVVY